MNESEIKEFLAWFSKATGIEDQAQLEQTLSDYTEDQLKQVMSEYDKYKQTVNKGSKGMKFNCPKGEMPKFFKVGGKMKQCGCKKIEPVSLTKEILDNMKGEFLKCGGKMKKMKKKK